MMRIAQAPIAVFVMTLAVAPLFAQQEAPKTNPALDEAKEAFKNGDYAGAFAAAERSLAADPGSVVGNYIAGVSKTRLGDLESGEKYLATVEATAPRMPGLQYQIGYLHFMKAQGIGDPAGAAQEYRIAAQHFASELEKNPSQLASLSSRAVALLRAGDYEEAVKAHDAWIAAQPQDNVPLISLGALYAKAGRGADVLALLDRLPQSDPASTSKAAFQLAQAFYLEQDFAWAQKLALRAAAGDAGNAAAVGLVAATSAEIGQLEQAATALDAYRKLDPPTAEIEQVGEIFEQRFGAGAAQAPPPAGTAWPQIKKLADPRYPREARDSKMTTKVVVVAEVLKDGSIGEMFLVPNRILDELRTLGFEAAAFDALRRSKIEPGSVNGQPAVMHVVVPISFVP